MPKDSTSQVALGKEIAALDEEIAKLKADLAMYKGFYEKKSKFLKTTLKRLDESNWENEQDLKFYLKKFGGHTAECEVSRKSYFVADGKGGWRKAKCDCGYEKAKERWK